MNEIIFVKPKEGFSILDPDFPHVVIPSEGQRVRNSAYWQRMKEQGAVEISKDGEVEDGEL